MKKSTTNEATTSGRGTDKRSVAHYLYALAMAFLLVIGMSVSVYAQTDPSGTPGTMHNSSYPDNRPNYNYLGLLGLLGLYGLHKHRMRQGTTVDRRIP